MLQQCSSNNSFSLLFPMSGSMEEPANYYSSSTSVVDCTLSLGTPSTRHTAAAPPMNRSSCGTPSFCWDIITQSKTQQAAASRVPCASSAGNSSSSNLGGDPLLLARRCANCDTTSTPLWRNGPRGPKSLCNACGIRYKKEERRAAASTASPSVNESISYSNFQRQQQQQQQQYPPWSCYPSTGTSSNNGSSWCQSDEDIDQATPCLSWRLNVVPPQFPVTDRPSLFQYQ